MTVRLRLAVPILLVFTWTMVFAPWLIAECRHDCGHTHTHWVGDFESECHAAEDLVDSLDDLADLGIALAPEDHSNAACSLKKGPDAAPSNDADPAPQAPSLEYFPAYPPVLISVEPRCPESSPRFAPRAPPDSAPPKETHGRGATPLLS